MPRYLSLGVPGEVEQLPNHEQVFDLPPLRRLLAVAFHLFDRPSAPSSKGGLFASLTISPIPSPCASLKTSSIPSRLNAITNDPASTARLLSWSVQRLPS